MSISISGSTGISGVDGSASTPAIQGSDTNTGISFGTDTVNINTGGTTRATVDSSGRFGVGTTSPTFRLHSYDAAEAQALFSGWSSAGAFVTAGAVRFGNTSSFQGRIDYDPNSNTNFIFENSYISGAISWKINGGEKARIDNSGRLLVGTTSASGNNLLQVNSNISVNGLNVGTAAPNSINIGNNNFGSLTTGYGNVCIGHSAGPDITSGYENIIVGYAQGFGGWNVSTGYYNSFYGIRAGEVVTTGIGNICIGYYANPSASSGSSQIVIGTYDSTGKGNNTGFINPNGGGVYQGNNSSSWSTTSDRRLKKNIVDNTEGLDVINQVRVVNFEYRLPEEIEQEELRSQALVKRDENDEVTGLQGVKLGVIAQELQQVCSDCVKEESSGVLSVVDDSLFWHLINAVKELSAKNASLEARLTALEGGAS